MKKIDVNKIFKGTIAVHITDYFPKKRRIRTRFSVDPRKWFRDTIHFTLNKPVKDLSTIQTSNLREAVWSSKKFCILIPFDKLYEINGKNLQGFGPDDTFFTRSIILPDNTMIIIMPNGISDAVENMVVLNEEISSQFQTDKNKFFEKVINGIIYRIFNPNNNWDIIKVCRKTIVDMGYSPEFFYDKSIREISDVLGLEFVAHYMHWTSNLEDFLIIIHVHKAYADNIPSVIVKASRNGIVFPIKESTGISGGFIDSTGKEFRFTKINGLTKEERQAAESLEYSMILPEIISSLQYPVNFAESLLKSKKIPPSYHNAIKFYIRDYQEYVKRKLSREIILLCPKLTELLNKKF